MGLELHEKFGSGLVAKNVHTQQSNCSFVSFSRGSFRIQILYMKIYVRFKSKLE